MFEIISRDYEKPEDRKKLGQECLYNYRTDTQRLTKFHTDNNSWYKYFRGVWNSADYPYRSKIFINMVFSVIETLQPRIMLSRFESLPYVSIRGLDRDSNMYKDQVESAANMQYNYPYFRMTMADWVKQSFILGLSTLRQRWRYKKKSSYLPAFVNYKMNMVKYDEVFEDQPYFECINQRNMLYPDAGKNFQDKEYLIEAVPASKEWISQQAEAGLLDKAAVGRIFDAAPDGSNYGDWQDDRQTKHAVDSIDTDLPNKNIKPYLLLYYYKNKANILAVVEHQTGEVLKVHPNFISTFPYSVITPINDPYQSEGISVVQTVYDLQEEMNAKRNLAMDWFTLLLAPIFLIEETSEIDPDMLIRQPGAIYPGRDVKNAIHQVQSPSIPPDFWKMLELWAGDIQLVTGINDYTKGTGSSSISNETATGIQLLQREANQRIAMMLQMIDCGILDMVNVQKRFNMIFWRETKEVPRSKRDMAKIGDGFIDISPKSFWGNYNYLIGPSGQPDVNPLIQKQQLMEFLATIAKIPPQLYAQENFQISYATILKEIARLSRIDESEFIGQSGNNAPYSQIMPGPDVNPEIMPIYNSMRNQMNVVPAGMVA